VLIHACGKNVVRNDARASEGDPIPCDVEKDVTGTESRAAKFFSLIVCYERESVSFETAIEDILAPNKREASPRQQIRIGSTSWGRSRSDLGRDLAQ
jgi:hypothetical protein